MSPLRVFNVILAFLALARAAAAQPERLPNVVVFFTDDQGTLDVGCFGAKDLHTPHLDRLAASGVRFTQAYAHTVCCPARAALMTGRHPQRSGVNSWTQGDMNGPDGINMSLDEVTIAEALKAAGYRTALFGKWHLGARRGYGPENQGFDEFFGIRNGFIDNFNHHFLHGDGYHDLYEGTKEVWAGGKYFPELISERALRFVEENRERPFFLCYGFNLPHYPEQSLAEHAALYRDLPEPRRSYAAAVSTTDHYIGKLVERLEALGLRENTVVVFQSDNGHSAEDYQIRGDNHKSGLPKGHNYGANRGAGFTGKWIGHKGGFLEGGIRTPAILSFPRKVPAGLVRDQAVTVMDWFPTILEFCGVKPPAVKLDGRSVLPVIASPAAPSAHPVLYFQWQEGWAVREGDWKLISTSRGARNVKEGEPAERRSLVNVADERPEAANYLETRPEIAARLTELHRRWKNEVMPPK